LEWNENSGLVSTDVRQDFGVAQVSQRVLEAPEHDYNGEAVYSASPGELNFLTLQRNLQNCLSIIDNEVMKDYLPSLQQCKVVPFDESSVGGLDDIQFFKITELVYQEDGFSVHKLSTVFHTLSNKPCTLVLMILSDGRSSNFYLGVRPRDSKNSVGTMRCLLEQSLTGLFPGSQTEEYLNEELKEDLNKLGFYPGGGTGVDIGCVSSVSCIADYKQEKDDIGDKDFFQGLEKFIYSMQGKKFSAVFMANNLEHRDIVETRREYERIYTLISPFANMQYNCALNNSSSSSDSNTQGQTRTESKGTTRGVSTSENVSDAETKGRNTSRSLTETKGQSESSSKGKTHTSGVSDGTNDAETNTKSFGVYGGIGGPLGAVFGNIGVSASVSRGKTHGVSHTDSVSDSISKNLTMGSSTSTAAGKTTGESESDTHTVSFGTGTHTSENTGESFSENSAYTRAITDTFGNSQAVTLNVQNKSLLNTLERLEQLLKRLDECESVGMWDFAAYFLGESRAESEMAANMYHSLISGNQSGLQLSAVNTWSDGERVDDILKYIRNFRHPVFFHRFIEGNAERTTAVDPTVMVSTNELAIQLGLPRESVKGLPVIKHAAFAQEIIGKSVQRQPDVIRLGTVSHLGRSTNTEVMIDLQSLSMHSFVTGSTGSGKSNTVYQLLSEAVEHKVNFLVIEPAKGEYKDIFGSDKDVSVYGTNPYTSPLLRLDPFSFPKGIHVFEHMDRLVEIFNVCWPMYAAMPAVLKNAIEKSYSDCGWDLMRSTNKFGENIYPGFADVARNVKEIIDTSEYDAENKGAYKGSLLTRLQSLTNGINGMIFTSDELNPMELFDKNVIADLSRVGSSETKSLIMGMLILKLQEYRMTSGLDMNSGLRHITVLEEAHNILRRTSFEQSSEGSNLAGKSVEMISNAIAEMRTYGEGFVIVDQAPGLLDMSAIRNTNTKLIMRLPDQSDRELVGHAANLNDEQIKELARLPCGVAAVYQNEWIQPVLCKVEKFKPKGGKYKYEPGENVFQSQETGDASNALLECIMTSEICPRSSRDAMQKLRHMVVNSKLEPIVKRDFMEYISAKNDSVFDSLSKLMYDFLSAGEAMDLAQSCNELTQWTETVVDALRPSIKKFPQNKIEIALGLLLNERANRDAAYNDLYCCYTEKYREGSLS